LLREKIPEAKGKATEHAARVVGVNPRYVSDAKALKGAATAELANRKVSRIRSLLPNA
jgi:hypothetical protein